MSGISGVADRIGGVIFSREPRNRTEQAMQELASQNIFKAQQYFASKGFGAEHGNGPIRVSFDNDNSMFGGAPNAAYSPGGIADSIFGQRNLQERIIIGADERGVSMAKDDDIIFHEYAHRILERNVDLKPEGEQGTVHEHIADVFASVLDEDDPFTIGESFKPGGIRSMENPGAEQYSHVKPVGYARNHYGEPVLVGKRVEKPDHFSEWARTRADKGGVHINVGVLNKPAAEIGKQIGLGKLGDIYTNTIKRHLPDGAGATDLIRGVLDSTVELFGKDSQEYGVVRESWKRAISR